MNNMQGEAFQEVQINTESAKILLGSWGADLATFEPLAGTSS